MKPGNQLVNVRLETNTEIQTAEKCVLEVFGRERAIGTLMILGDSLAPSTFPIESSAYILTALRVTNELYRADHVHAMLEEYDNELIAMIQGRG